MIKQFRSKTRAMHRRMSPDLRWFSTSCLVSCLVLCLLPFILVGILLGISRIYAVLTGQYYPAIGLNMSNAIMIDEHMIESKLKELEGEWHIENPYPNDIGNYDRNNWKTIRLFLYANKKCKWHNFGWYEDYVYDDPDLSLNGTIEGYWELMYSNLRNSDGSITQIPKIGAYLGKKEKNSVNPGAGFNLWTLKIEGQDAYRLVSLCNCEYPPPKGHACGVVWKRVDRQ